MAVYALISPGGSPGVTTTALALALTWPEAIVVAECDPSGGDILAGLFAGHLQAPRGLLGVAFEAGRGPSAIAAELSSQLVPLDDAGNRKFLAGISDPRQALGLSTVWPGIAIALTSLEGDVIADCGRFDAGASAPLGVLVESNAVLVVMRPTLRQVAAARPRVDMLFQALGGLDKVGLLLIGDHGLKPVDISRTLQVRVVASLPDDISTARLLSDGDGRRSRLDRTPLMRAAKVACRSLAQLARPRPAAELTASSGAAGGSGPSGALGYPPASAASPRASTAGGSGGSSPRASTAGGSGGSSPRASTAGSAQ